MMFMIDVDGFVFWNIVELVEVGKNYIWMKLGGGEGFGGIFENKYNSILFLRGCIFNSCRNVVDKFLLAYYEAY